MDPMSVKTSDVQHLSQRVLKAAGELVRYVRLHFQGLAPLAERYYDLPRAPGEDPIWISLTTLPSRIEKVAPTIKSLLDQSVRVDGIRINLPNQSRREKCGYKIPLFLKRCRPLDLASCAEDHGPITKLLPTVYDFQQIPDTKIIIVDDDTIYPRTMVESLVQTSELHPDSAACMRGWRVPPGDRHRDRRYVQASTATTPTQVAIMQGASGFLVKPRFFENDALIDEQAPPEAFFVDDILVSGTLAKLNIPRYVAPSPIQFVRISSISSMGTPSLVHGENKDGHNNAALYRYFSEHWKLRD